MFTFLNDAMFFTMRCFPILNDVIFRRCLKKNIDLDVCFKKYQNIVLTMHISDVFGKKYFKQIEICNNPMKFATNCDKSAFLIIC